MSVAKKAKRNNNKVGCVMRKNNGFMFVSKKFPKIAAFIKMFLEYTNDYLGGQKWGALKNKQLTKQR